MAQDAFGQLESTLDLYLVKKAPSLPKNFKELLVSLAPWATVVMIIIGLPAFLAVLGISAYTLPLAYWAGARLGFMYYLSIAFLGATLVIRAMAVPGLFARKLAAWKLLYYAALLGMVYSLLNYAIFSALIGTLVGLYFLFQIKEYYK